LLGLELFENDPEVIQNAADRQLTFVRRFLHGEHAQEARQLVQELIGARACLLDPPAKAAYDEALRRELAASAPPQPSAAVVAESYAWRAEEAESQEVGPARSAESLLGRLHVMVSWLRRAVRGICEREAAGSRIGAPFATDFQVPEELIRRYLRTIGKLTVVALVLLLAILLVRQLPDRPAAVRSSEPPEKSAGSVEGEGPAPSSFPEGEGENSAQEEDVAATEQSQSGVPSPPEAPETSHQGPPSTVEQPRELPSAPPEEPADSPGPSDQSAGQEAAANEGMEGSLLELSAPVPPQGQLPVPDRDAVAAVRAQLEAGLPDAGKADLAGLQAILQEMLRTAGETEDPVQKFAAYQTVAHWALRAESVTLLRQALDGLTGAFQLDRGELLRQVFSAVEGLQISADFKRDLVRLILVEGELASDMGDFQSARWCFGTAQSLAQQVKDSKLNDSAVQRAKFLTVAEQHYQKACQAREKLATAPEDSEAHTALGIYLCLVRSRPDWKEGLSHLAQGSDPLLRKLAELELRTSPQSPLKEKVALGDSWKEAAQEAPAELRSAYLRRAAYWYRLALPEATGFTRLRLEDFLRSEPGA
jgi:hypothetical protein